MVIGLATFPSLVLAIVQMYADQCGDPGSFFLLTLALTLSCSADSLMGRGCVVGTWV